MSTSSGQPPWRVWRTSRSAARAASPAVEDWLDGLAIPDRRPFLIGPDSEYDPELNSYFASLPMVTFAEGTQEAVSRDLARFFTFVHWNRRSGSLASSLSWRTATEQDRAAYFDWRNVQAKGPRVTATTWNREVATVGGFYRWAVAAGLVSESPVLLREGRTTRGRRGRRLTPEVARELRPDRRAYRLEWLPAAEYRQWRDVGLRGYLLSGERDMKFRGTLAGRNVAYADFMLRTGLRLSEQSALLVSEIPQRRPTSRYRKFRLPSAIAKNGAARDIYVPDQVLGALSAYGIERALFIRHARARGTYDRLEDILVTDAIGSIAKDVEGTQIDVESLTVHERRRLYVAGADGLEPAMLWVTEAGLPMSSNSWQNVFAKANERCLRQGVSLRCHPHALRHTYAVRTLDQLQRGHIDALGGLTVAQRRHYSMVFGDPLDWVRKRLGHRSAVTTSIYMHTLAELEFETRIALTQDDAWDTPDATP